MHDNPESTQLHTYDAHVRRHTLFVATVAGITASVVTAVLTLGVGYMMWGAVSPSGEIASGIQETRSDIDTNLRGSKWVEREHELIDVVARANPAVVSIIVTQDVPVYEQYFETYDPFGGLFGPGNEFRIPRQREMGTEERRVGGGSGFFVTEDGLIVTNRHVVALESARYSAVTDTGVTYPVEVLARDPVFDIAILRVEEQAPEEGFPTLPLGDSGSLQLGQTVIAIGNALGEFQNSVSVGVVSGLSRSIVAGDRQRRTSELLEEVIQTDAAINPGNSGGPLLNSSGEVVGVNVAVALGSDNIGFALPVNMVKSVVDSVAEHGEIRMPFLGVRYVMLNERIAGAQDLTVTYGAFISSGQHDVAPVQRDSPAASAGIRAGDVIIEIGGLSLRERSLANAIRTFSPGQTVEVVINRGGEEVRLEVELAEFTNSQ